MSVLIFLTSSAVAATRYVSDDLYTYVHSGPGTKYKITGSVDAGDYIKLIKTDADAGYSQIEDTKGRIGWISSKYVSRQPGLKVRMEKLEIKLAQLNTKSRSDKDSIESYSTQIRKLKSTNASLSEELQSLQVLNKSLTETLDTDRIDLLLRWFTYGGIVAGVGLLLGLILPSVIPSRRKRNSW